MSSRENFSNSRAADALASVSTVVAGEKTDKFGHLRGLQSKIDKLRQVISNDNVFVNNTTRLEYERQNEVDATKESVTHFVMVMKYNFLVTDYRHLSEKIGLFPLDLAGFNKVMISNEEIYKKFNNWVTKNDQIRLNEPVYIKGVLQEKKKLMVDKIYEMIMLENRSDISMAASKIDFSFFPEKIPNIKMLSQVAFNQR